jgi:hypothetical protein
MPIAVAANPQAKPPRMEPGVASIGSMTTVDAAPPVAMTMSPSMHPAAGVAPLPAAGQPANPRAMLAQAQPGFPQPAKGNGTQPFARQANGAPHPAQQGASPGAPAVTPPNGKPALPMTDAENTQIATLEQIKAAAAARATHTPQKPRINAPGNRAPAGSTLPSPAPQPKDEKNILKRLVIDWRKSSVVVRTVGVVLPLLGIILVTAPSRAQDDGDPSATAADTASPTNPAGMAESANNVPTPAGSSTAPAPAASTAADALEGIKAAVGTAVGIDVTKPKAKPQAPVRSEPKIDPRDNMQIVAQGGAVLSPREKGIHRQAMNALLAGDYATAMTLSSQLAAAHPESSTYRDVMRVLYSKSKGGSKSF